MFSIERKFRCTKCGEVQIQEVSFTKLYKINNSNIEYVDLNCEQCGELHYVASEGYILDELTAEAKEKKFKELKHYLGSGAKERFLKDAKFILIKDAVIPKSDVKCIECVGEAAF
ncbi:hypothetical protein [Alkaliphilus sp. B6464]|uniref:hypothetical protein n=1 Tax=Alkaliphilus sp. B6464 TaxID=2731219 RepID=UPI001BAD0173|nr:hypothetical protein [Alkaliphilus sp. B6464]QUH21874.1 hypothetical protein HYG84_18225 [Alkaliphilus sp. B6464]